MLTLRKQKYSYKIQHLQGTMHHMICDKVPEALLDIVVLEEWVVLYWRGLLIAHYVPIECGGARRI